MIEASIDLKKMSGDWEHIDVALRTIVKRRGLLDANEANWLREALRVRIWREVGCVSMADYMERRLGYTPRTASDRMRVALALEDLPKLAAALENGLPHSAVRELTRVATGENEQTWLDAVRGKSVHEIEAMVSGRGRGANPDDPPHPSLAGRTLPFEGIRPATEALVRDAWRKLQSERGGGAILADDELLAAFARAILEDNTGERTKAPYQIAVTLCEHCGRGWQDSGGRKFELSSADIERACCDAERIGLLDSADPERATQDVTPAKRRMVRRRDKGRCRVPGCRSTRCLEIHHIVAQALGGSHDVENTILICDGCHAALHRGLITITGTSSNLTVTRRHEVAYDLAPIDEHVQGTTPADFVQSEFADDSCGEPVRPAAQRIEPRDDNSGQAHGRAIHSEIDAHVGTNLRHAADQRRGTDEARTSASTMPAERVVQHTEPAASNICENIHHSEIDTHVGTNLRRLSRFERERLRADARSALLNLGFRSGEAGTAVDLALRRLGEVPLEDLLREALRSSRR